jgi:hypothetical protein
VVRGVRCPSRWMREVQVMLFWNAEMASLLVALGNLAQSLEKHRIYSRRLCSSCCL